MACIDCFHKNVCRNAYSQIVEYPNVCGYFRHTADVVEVVRCNWCIHKVDYCGRIMCGRTKYEFKDGVGGLVTTTSDHFCSYGERK